MLEREKQADLVNCKLWNWASVWNYNIDVMLVLIGAYWDSRERKSHAELIRMSDEKYVHVWGRREFMIEGSRSREENVKKRAVRERYDH